MDLEFKHNFVENTSIEIKASDCDQLIRKIGNDENYHVMLRGPYLPNGWFYNYYVEIGKKNIITSITQRSYFVRFHNQTIHRQHIIVDPPRENV